MIKQTDLEETMCGIAAYLGKSKEAGLRYAERAGGLLQHRGPDDIGIYNDEEATLLHRRLSIIDLSPMGHQPMESSCGRYCIVFNGEIYNHEELRDRYLPGLVFRGHSDTETIIELFRIMEEKMLDVMVGMWAIAIWDKRDKRMFISRDRYGQKPLYIRRKDGAWLLASEMKPLLADGEQAAYDTTAIVEYLALGNYGHLGEHTFFKYIQHFPQGSYAWLRSGDEQLKTRKYWELPLVSPKDKVPFTDAVKKELHDRIVAAVLSQTLADVPIGITLSGGIDSSIIAGMLASYYDKQIHIFTAQSAKSKYDESKYVDAVVAKFGKGSFVLHKKNLSELSVKSELEHYIRVQEEPFGDPSIMAHGFLMKMAADAGIKVVLNGQGADELFFGYNNMAQAILVQQLAGGQAARFIDNLKAMRLGKSYMLRTLLSSALPGVEAGMRTRSRLKRRNVLRPELMNGVDNDLVALYKYNNIHDVWRESVYGVHIPHLVHYDDRNGMSCSIEGRMPFLDHRIAEYVATIQPPYFLEGGKRKHILREACRQYLPDEIYNRTDKIGFYTPLVDALVRDSNWVAVQLVTANVYNAGHQRMLMHKLREEQLTVPDALLIWRAISVGLWMQAFDVAH